MTLARRRGFSLIELLVVLCIVAIVVAWAIPAYRNHLMRAQRAQAHAALLQAAHYMQRFYAANDRFDQALDGTPVALPASLQPESGRAVRHRIVIRTVTAGRYLLAAQPEPDGADERCGVLTVDQAGRRSAEGPEGSARCWR